MRASWQTRQYRLAVVRVPGDVGIGRGSFRADRDLQSPTVVNGQVWPLSQALFNRIVSAEGSPFMADGFREVVRRG